MLFFKWVSHYHKVSYCFYPRELSGLVPVRKDIRSLHNTQLMLLPEIKRGSQGSRSEEQVRGLPPIVCCLGWIPWLNCQPSSMWRHCRPFHLAPCSPNWKQSRCQGRQRGKGKYERTENLLSPSNKTKKKIFFTFYPSPSNHTHKVKVGSAIHKVVIKSDMILTIPIVKRITFSSI